MTHDKFEKLPEGPNEGLNRFYDQNKPEEEKAGLEYAIKNTEHRIKNDPDRPEGIFEEKLKELRGQLEKVKEKLKK